MTDAKNTVDYDPRAPKREEILTPRVLETLDGEALVLVGVESATREPNGDVLLTLRMRPK